MDSYIKWYDGLNKTLKIIFAVLFWFCFVYRLLYVIKDNGKNIGRLVYFIINVIPAVSIVSCILDVVCAVKNKVPLSFEDVNKVHEEYKKDENVVHEQ